jgi:hypothetical protein
MDIDMPRKGKADIDARMDKVRLKIQIDFGVGDIMVPGPRMIEYWVFLVVDTIQLLAYPIESSIAEKLHSATPTAE